MYTYAQLDENNICVSVSQLAGPIHGDNIIPLEDGQEDCLGMLYDNGKWVKV